MKYNYYLIKITIDYKGREIKETFLAMATNPQEALEEFSEVLRERELQGRWVLDDIKQVNK
uniref:Uncharacterized protein n=1 Tax=viral metagenome TaxID=1070528 RepID=A0A6H1ZK30_9ZZZZ